MSDFSTAANNFNQVVLQSAGMIQAGESSKEDRRLVREQNQLSREWNEKIWHMQNEYNSPTAQVARLVDAGLNPALAYGDVTSGLAQNANGSYGQATTNPDQSSARMLEAASLFQQQNLTNSAIQVNQSQAEANQALADKYRSETKGQNLSNTYEAQVLDYKVAQSLATLRGSNIANDVADFEKKFRLFVGGLEYESYQKDMSDDYNYFWDKRKTELGILQNTLNKIYDDDQYVKEATSLLSYNAETGRISANALALNARSYAYLVPFLAREATARTEHEQVKTKLDSKELKYFELGALKTLIECYNLYKDGQLTDQKIINVFGRNFNLYQRGQEEPTKGGILGSGLNAGSFTGHKMSPDSIPNVFRNQQLEGIQWLYNTIQSWKDQ